MKLGTKGHYTVMALVDLAYYGKDKPLPLSEIAERQALPISYLEQLFVKLRQKGFVVSTRGQQGGYQLAREAKNIQVSDILEAIGESIKTTRCNNDHTTSCLGNKSRCLTHHLWAGLGQQVRQYLQQVSLEDVCESRLP